MDKVCIFVVGGPDDIRAQTVDAIIAALRTNPVSENLRLFSSLDDAGQLKWNQLSSYSGWQR